MILQNNVALTATAKGLSPTLTEFLFSIAIYQRYPATAAASLKSNCITSMAK